VKRVTQCSCSLPHPGGDVRCLGATAAQEQATGATPSGESSSKPKSAGDTSSEAAAGASPGSIEPRSSTSAATTTWRPSSSTRHRGRCGRGCEDAGRVHDGQDAVQAEVLFGGAELLRSHRPKRPAHPTTTKPCSGWPRSLISRGCRRRSGEDRQVQPQELEAPQLEAVRDELYFLLGK